MTVNEYNFYAVIISVRRWYSSGTLYTVHLKHTCVEEKSVHYLIQKLDSPRIFGTKKQFFFFLALLCHAAFVFVIPLCYIVFYHLYMKKSFKCSSHDLCANARQKVYKWSDRDIITELNFCSSMFFTLFFQQHHSPSLHINFLKIFYAEIFDLTIVEKKKMQL